MATARTSAVTLHGTGGILTHTEAHTSPATPPSAPVENRDRIRAAIRNSGLPWPTTPVTLRISPPAPVGWSGVDLALACAVLAATGNVPTTRLAGTVLIGELALDGHIRPVRGVLPAVHAARQAGLQRAIVPSSTLPEAALVPGIRVLGAHRLSDVVAWLRGQDNIVTTPDPPIPGDTPAEPDLADLNVAPDVVQALEVAAAGGHHLLLIGPPGPARPCWPAGCPGFCRT